MLILETSVLAWFERLGLAPAGGSRRDTPGFEDGSPTRLVALILYHSPTNPGGLGQKRISIQGHADGASVASRSPDLASDDVVVIVVVVVMAPFFRSSNITHH